MAPTRKRLPTERSSPPLTKTKVVNEATMAMKTALRRMLIQVPLRRNWSDWVAPKMTKARIEDDDGELRAHDDAADSASRHGSRSARPAPWSAGGLRRPRAARGHAGARSWRDGVPAAVGFDRAGDQPDDLAAVGILAPAHALDPAEAHDLDVVGNVEDHLEVVADQEDALPARGAAG